MNEAGRTPSPLSASQTAFGRSNFDPDAIVESDAPCRKCSYNVRGLRYGGRCPECGTPVGVSTLGDLLRFSDPDWLKKLRLGLALVIAEVAVAITLWVTGIFMFLGASRSWISFLGAFVGICGVWLLTAPDPSGLGEQQYSAARRFVRIALGFDLVFRALRLFAATVAVAPLDGLLQTISPLLILVLAAGEFAKFLYLRKLANRIPDKWLARLARFLQWSYPVALAALSLAISVLRTGDPTTPFFGLVLRMLPIFTFLNIPLFIVMLVFFIRLRRVIRHQSILASQTWTQAGALDPDGS